MRSGVTGIQQRSIRPRTWSSRVRRLSNKTTSKHLHSPSFEWRPVTILQDASVESFRRNAFQVQRPVLMPPGFFTYLPAITKWFKPCTQQDGAFQLDSTYLEQFGDAVVPLELSTTSASSTIDGEDFQRSGLLYFRVFTSCQLLISRRPLRTLFSLPTRIGITDSVCMDRGTPGCIPHVGRVGWPTNAQKAVPRSSITGRYASPSKG